MGTAPTLAATQLRILKLNSLNLVNVAGAGMLALLHLFLFLYYRPQRADLYYALYLSAAASTSLMLYLRGTTMDGPARLAVHRGNEVSAAVAIVLLLTFTYAACRRALHWRWLIALSGTALLLLVAVLTWPHREVGR